MIVVLNNKIDMNLYELLSKANEFSKKSRLSIGVLLITNEAENLHKLKYFSVDKVVLFSHKKLKHFSLDPFLRLALKGLEILKPKIIISPATHFGRTIMPALAVKYKTGLTADCTDLDIDEEGNLIQIRPAIGGNIMGVIKTLTKPQLATVRPKSFEVKKFPEREFELIKLDVTEKELIDRCELISVKKKEDNSKVEEADVIVSVGKGIRKKENIEIAKELAELLHGALGATRAVVDLKWLDHEHQIGLSGKTVKPKIYIAAGISGAIQHIAGMQTSELIIAINKDKHAPIFNYADIGLIGDAYSILKNLVLKIKEGSGSNDR